MATSTIPFAGILSALGEHHGAIVSSQSACSERRLRYRYPLDLSVRFKSLSGLPRFAGVGRTLNLSSGGVLVVCRQIVGQHEIGAGAQVQMSIGVAVAAGWKGSPPAFSPWDRSFVADLPFSLSSLNGTDSAPCEAQASHTRPSLIRRC
jgi:hypothetical protein